MASLVTRVAQNPQNESAKPPTNVENGALFSGSFFSPVMTRGQSHVDRISTFASRDQNTQSVNYFPIRSRYGAAVSKFKVVRNWTVLYGVVSNVNAVKEKFDLESVVVLIVPPKKDRTPTSCWRYVWSGNCRPFGGCSV